MFDSIIREESSSVFGDNSVHSRQISWDKPYIQRFNSEASVINRNKTLSLHKLPPKHKSSIYNQNYPQTQPQQKDLSIAPEHITCTTTERMTKKGSFGLNCFAKPSEDKAGSPSAARSTLNCFSKNNVSPCSKKSICSNDNSTKLSILLSTNSTLPTDRVMSKVIKI